MVAAIVAATLSAASVVWVNQSGIKESQAKIQSDVRDIITRMDAAKEIAAAESKTREALTAADNKLQQERLAAFEKKLDDVERQSKLNDLEVRAVREKLTGR
jgi:lipopolysaccharide biosynthesis protein